MSPRRKHLPPPVRHQALNTSSLKGMERPAQSFKSFIQNFSPHVVIDENKPLPPIPTSSTTPITAEAYPWKNNHLERLPSITYWKPPADWDLPGTPEGERKTSPLFLTRRYSPLLPEPSPEIYIMQVEQKSRPCDLKSIHERKKSSGQDSRQVPEVPLRNPERISPSRTTFGPSTCHQNAISTLVSSDCLLLSDSSCSAVEVSDGRVSQPQAMYDSEVSTTSMANKRYGWDPLRLETSVMRNSRISAASISPISPLDEPEMNFTTKSQHSQTCFGGIDTNTLEDTETERMQRLSVSHDYHNILANDYHDGRFSGRPTSIEDIVDSTRNPEETALAAPPHIYGLVPRPLSWNKSMSSMALQRSNSVEERHTDEPSQVTTSPRRRSWMHLAHLGHGVRRRRSSHGPQSRSASESSVPSPMHIPDAEVDQILTKQSHFPQLMPRLKRLASRYKRPKLASDDAKKSKSTHTGTRSPSTQTPDKPTQLISFPGGFALVRQSPTSTPPSHPSSLLDKSVHYVGTEDTLPIEGTLKHRSSSIYSAHSGPLVAPTVAIQNALRQSASNRSSFHSCSGHSSSPPSPLAQEIKLPRTPPPSNPALLDTQPLDGMTIPNSAQNQTSLDTQGHKRSDSATEEGTHWHSPYIGILEKARGKRDTWRRQHKEAKHEKLKQSIRLVGPTDPSPVAGYVSPREGKLIKESIGYEYPGNMI